MSIHFTSQPSDKTEDGDQYDLTRVNVTPFICLDQLQDAAQCILEERARVAIGPEVVLRHREEIEQFLRASQQHVQLYGIELLSPMEAQLAEHIIDFSSLSLAAAKELIECFEVLAKAEALATGHCSATFYLGHRDIEYDDWHEHSVGHVISHLSLESEDKPLAYEGLPFCPNFSRQRSAHTLTSRPDLLIGNVVRAHPRGSSIFEADVAHCVEGFRRHTFTSFSAPRSRLLNKA